MALLGEVMAPGSEFVRLVAAKDYAGAIAMVQWAESLQGRPPQEEVLGAFMDLADEIGEIPPDGWRFVHIEGPVETRYGLVVSVACPAWNRSGADMDWFFSFELIEGMGEEWRIGQVTPTN